LHDAETGSSSTTRPTAGPRREHHQGSDTIGAFAASNERIAADSRVHVRNAFLSVVENVPFRVESGRDANSGRTRCDRQDDARDELAYHMITTSSNLATNLLLGVIGPDAVNRTLKELDSMMEST